MKIRLTMRDIGNAIEACDVAIDNITTLIDSNIIPGPRNKARQAWAKEDREDFEEWQAQLKRVREVRKKLMVIERGK